MKNTLLTDSPAQDFNNQTFNDSNLTIREKEGKLKGQFGNGSWRKQLLTNLQEARDGENDLIDPPKSQEVLDAYFFGPSNRNTKRLYKRRISQAKRRKRT
jgi:hypothetical protein